MVTFRHLFLGAVLIALPLAVEMPGSNTAEAREQIRIVGSSTVFPFSASVAEQFGRATDFKTPVVERTGSGGGLKLFCSGVGDRYPDITNASRRIKQSEVRFCASNGVTDIVEVKIGFDGIVLANSIESEPLRITLRQLWLALAKDVPTTKGNGGSEGETEPNPHQKWSDIDSSLPHSNIEVFGPPPTSGTRDAFVELAMEGGCKTFPWIVDLKKSNNAVFKSLCHTIREDGAFIDAGENDNLIVQKLGANPNTFGIFGFSFLDQNYDRVQGSFIDGVEPQFEIIATGNYPISRSLYFYVKALHVDLVPEIAAFLAVFTDDDTWGPDGYLGDKGLIPMPDEERRVWAKRAGALELLQM
jgi:phosphate transport system substrate-binding protein